MDRRIIISVVGGLLILAVGVFVKTKLADSKKAPEINNNKIIASVFVEEVKNSEIPIIIFATGSVLAKDRMVIFSEVQGVFLPSSKAFKAGTKYRRGETLIRVNNEEFKASVIAKRSSFKNMITGILPDIQFDYASSLTTWNSYLQSIDINKSLPKLPAMASDKENNFITSRNINATYYSIKNMETRLQKYSITAPYAGTLVDAYVTPGTLINPGQKLGEYIKPDVFELELNINANLQEFLEKGKSVSLHNIENTKSWIGKVTRINQKIDRNSQTIKVFVEVSSEDLKEGEYLEAEVFARQEMAAVEIPRALLVNNNAIYMVHDSILVLHELDVVYTKLNSVIAKGLTDGTSYISKPVIGAFDGMKVKIISEK